eukprot:5826553-Amphidinium_carterae.1
MAMTESPGELQLELNSAASLHGSPCIPNDLFSSIPCRLSDCAKSSNEAFTKYEFANATTATCLLLRLTWHSTTPRIVCKPAESLCAAQVKAMPSLG